MFLGWAEDATGNWNTSFRLAGVFAILAGCVVLCEHFILKCCHGDVYLKSGDSTQIGEEELFLKETGKNENIDNHTEIQRHNEHSNNVSISVVPNKQIDVLDLKQIKLAPLANIADV